MSTFFAWFDHNGHDPIVGACILFTGIILAPIVMVALVRAREQGRR